MAVATSTAILGGAAIAGTAGIIGAKKAAKGQQAAADAQERVARAQQERFESIYGPVERNLSEFFTDLTPEEATTRGLEGIQREFEEAGKTLTRTLAQRGIKGGGVEAAGVTSLAEALAGAKARELAEAPIRTRAEQLAFLAQGQGLGTSAAANLTSALGSKAAFAALQGQQAGQQIAQAGQLIGQFLPTLTQQPSAQPQPTIAPTLQPTALSAGLSALPIA